MFCKYCGQEIVIDSNYCNYCGKSQKETKKSSYPVNYFRSNTAWGYNSFEIDIIEKLYLEAINKFPKMRSELKREENGENHILVTKTRSYFMPDVYFTCEQFLLKYMLDNGYTQEVVPSSSEGTKKMVFSK